MEEKLRKEKTPELKPALKKPKEEPTAEKKSMPAAKPAAPKAEQVAKVETVSDKVSLTKAVFGMEKVLFPEMIIQQSDSTKSFQKARS